MDMQASREFLAELKVLTHVHHLNLVKFFSPLQLCLCFHDRSFDRDKFFFIFFLTAGTVDWLLRGGFSLPCL